MERHFSHTRRDYEYAVLVSALTSTEYMDAILFVGGRLLVRLTFEQIGRAEANTPYDVRRSPALSTQPAGQPTTITGLDYSFK